MPGGCGRRPSGRRPDRGREHSSQTCRRPDIFARCRATGATARVSVDSIGAHSNDLSTDPAINGDGTPAASFTLASTPGPGDTISCSINDQVNFTDHPDQCPDICIHSSQQPTLKLITTRKRPVGAGFRQEAIPTKGQSHGRTDSL
jgi:hypothetical protein